MRSTCRSFPASPRATASSTGCQRRPCASSMKHLLPVSFVDDLRTQKLRLTLTLFGIFWGTFAVVVLLAFGTGLERKAEEEMARGTGIVSLQSGITRNTWRGLPEGRRIRLRPDDVQLLRDEVPGIGLLSEGSFGNGTLIVDERSVQGTLYGIEPDYAPLNEIRLEPGGRFINPRDIQERRHVAVIGRGLSAQLFDVSDPVGRQFVVRGSTFTVVGVLQAREGSRGFLNDERAFVPATTHRIIFGSAYISSIMYSPVSPDVGAETLERAFALLGARHGFDPSDRRALGQWDSAEFDNEIRFFLLALNIFLAVVGGFTLLVGGIGVANIMFVVVRERRVEIGVKRAMGARRSHIVTQFMAEAALLVATGAVLGFLFAVLVVTLAGMIPVTEDMGQPVISGGVALLTAAVLALVALAAGV